MSHEFSVTDPRAIPIFAFEVVRELANDLEQYLTVPRAVYVRYGCSVWLAEAAKLIEQPGPREDLLNDLLVMSYLTEAQTGKSPFDLEVLRSVPGEELYEKHECYADTARRIQSFFADLTFSVDLDLPVLRRYFRNAVFDFLNLQDPKKEAPNVPTHPTSERITRTQN
jgi:hypothetical protein